MTWTTALALGALYLGIAITAAGVVGVYRFPDIYTRLNALAKVTTSGALLIHLGAAGLMPPGQGGKGVLTACVLVLTTPVVTMAIALAAHRLGLRGVLVRDELESERPPP